jgi:hypothetical protein
MRPPYLFVLALSAACSAAGGAPEPELTRPPAPSSAVTPSPSPSPSAPAEPVPTAPLPPQASPVPGSTRAVEPAAPEAQRPLTLDDVFPNGMPPSVKSTLPPPPPTAYEAEAEARAAPYQACARDRDCTVAIEGCCDANGHARGIGVARKQLEAYRQEFRCTRANCATRAGDMLCGADGDMPSCITVPVPKARCVEGRCTFHGHY